jgi:hypothetical protein
MIRKKIQSNKMMSKETRKRTKIFILETKSWKQLSVKTLLIKATSNNLQIERRPKEAQGRQCFLLDQVKKQ